jgi:hypothetical protein
MMVSKISKLTNPLSQMIHGGARFEQEHISFDGEQYASLIVVGLPENLIGYFWGTHPKGKIRTFYFLFYFEFSLF